VPGLRSNQDCSDRKRQPYLARDGRWLTVRHVAQRLNVSRDTVVRWIQNGLLSAVDVGTCSSIGPHRASWRISPESLQAFLKARASRPPVPARTRRNRAGEHRVIEFIK